MSINIEPSIFDWIGKTVQSSAYIDVWTAQALQSTIDTENFLIQEGSPLPPLWHWAYFKPTARAVDIGSDGHPKKGGILPPISLPRRMWAGGKLEFLPLNPLRIGDQAQRTTTIISIAPKVGRTGSMVFLSLKHEISNSRGICITEYQDIVYRDANNGSTSQSAPTKPGPIRQLLPEESMLPAHVDEVCLFRYSALTFNSHRIHYDQEYAKNIEGYPNLVIHGPLMATLLVNSLFSTLPSPELLQFNFRALSPGFLGNNILTFVRPILNKCELIAESSDGRVLMSANAHF